MRPGKPYPATFRICIEWSHGELNPDFRHAIAVSSRWTMTPSVVVARFESLAIPNLIFVFRFETTFRVSHPAKRRTHRAAHAATSFASSFSSATHSGPPGSRTPITWVQAKRPTIKRAALLLEVRPGIEPGLPPYHSGVPPKHLQTISVQLPPSPFFLASSAGFSC